MAALNRIVEEHSIDLIGFIDHLPLEYLLEKIELTNHCVSNVRLTIQEP